MERVSANDNYGDSRKVVDRFDRREGRDVAPRVGGGRYDDQRRDRASARDDPKFDRYKIIYMERGAKYFDLPCQNFLKE